MRLIASFVSTALCGAAITACGTEPTGDTRTVTRAIELDNADAVAVALVMGAGELRVDGGAPRLMDASFRFNVPSWEPVVSYNRDGGRAALSVSQPNSSAPRGRGENRWELKFNDTVPMDLRATLGAGEATLTIGTLNLQGVEINQGVGQLTVDLRGAPKRSYEARVNGGVGEARVRLPRDVGIVASAAGGLGGINVDGLEKRGDTWVNPQHEHDPIAIRLIVKRGIGEISIAAD